jgi:hypothetical protein
MSFIRRAGRPFGNGAPFRHRFFVIFLRRIANLTILVVLLLRLSTLSIASVSGVIFSISVVLRTSAALLAALLKRDRGLSLTEVSAKGQRTANQYADNTSSGPSLNEFGQPADMAAQPSHFGWSS